MKRGVVDGLYLEEVNDYPDNRTARVGIVTNTHATS